MHNNKFFQHTNTTYLYVCAYIYAHNLLHKLYFKARLILKLNFSLFLLCCYYYFCDKIKYKVF